MMTPNPILGQNPVYPNHAIIPPPISVVAVERKQIGKVEIVLKTPAEALGEYLLRPIIDLSIKCFSELSEYSYQSYSFLKNVYTSSTNAFTLPNLLPLASAQSLEEATCNSPFSVPEAYSTVPEAELKVILAKFGFNSPSDSSHAFLTQKLFEMLLDEDSLVDSHSNLEEILTRLIDTQGLSLLQYAAAKGKDKLVKKLHAIFKKRGAHHLIHLKDSDGKNAVHLAAIGGHASLIPILKTLDLNLADRYGLTPLHWAIHEEHLQTVNKLLEAGARLHETWTVNDSQISIPLIGMAVISGNPEIFDFLAKTKLGETLIALTDKIEGIGNLLHLAIHSKQNTMLKHMLRNYNKEINSLLEQRDAHGRTPLKLAAHCGDLTAIHLLVKHGAEIETGAGSKGGTAIHDAALAGKQEAIELLGALGADLLALDHENRTPSVLIENKTDPLYEECKHYLKSQAQAKKIVISRPPDFKKELPENLVFQGGGAKGIAYVGAIRKMQEEGVLVELKRVAGTSAGSITAALLAVGYEAKEIETALAQIDIAKFFHPKGEFEKDVLDIAKKNPSLIDGLLEVGKRVFAEYWVGLSTLLAPVERAKKVLNELYHMTGICDGEELRLEIEKLIEKKTGTSYCTFKELSDLAKEDPQKYKDLYVYAIRLKQGSLSEIIRFSSEDECWHHLIISDAIRASVSIPGVFDPHTLHFKRISSDSSIIRYSIDLEGQFMDGGVLKNYPVESFDQNKYQGKKYTYGSKTNRRTLGFSLEDSGVYSNDTHDVEKIKNVMQLAKAVALTFFHAETIIRGKDPSRTITIPIEGMGLLDLDASDEQKSRVIASAYNAVEVFFKQFSSNPEDVYLFEEEIPSSRPPSGEITHWKYALLQDKLNSISVESVNPKKKKDLPQMK